MAASNMKAIKRRIKSVESTMQITKAMELVSSSKLRKAKERAEQAVPFFNLLYQTMSEVASEAVGFHSAYTELREDGAEYVICCFHWGQELYYHPNQGQIDLAHACIDAGANLIYGTHTHCLQPIEDYKGGLILYSMGNWSFGGSSSPKDKDTAIVQVQIRRDENGVISNTGYNVIPCCVSSRPILEGYSGDNYNDYCPTPYTVGSDAFNRVLSKLDGSFQAESEGRDYSDIYASYS